MRSNITYQRDADLPYAVVLMRTHGRLFEKSFATMREAETFIRRNSPASLPALSTLYDRPASET